MKSVYPIILVSLLSFVLLSSNSKEFNSEKKKLHVFVIGVNNFNDKKWENPRLEKNILEVSEDLSTFFSKKRFNAKVHTLVSKGETNSNFIKEYLFKEFYKIDDHSLVILFFISHGVKSIEDGKENYYLITSDTKVKPTVKNAFSIENDFLPITSRLRKCLVMSFIDACNSEYGIELTSKIDSAIRSNNLGVEQFMIGASLKDKKSYNAFFSKSLLSMWRDDKNIEGCTTKIYDGQIRKALRPYYQSILKEANLSHLANKFNPKVLIDYRSEKICLETFKRKSGFILFSNFSPETIICHVFNKINEKSIIEFDVNSGSFIPFHSDLDKEYFIVIKDKNGVSKDTIFKSIKNGLAIETYCYPVEQQSNLASLYKEAASLGEILNVDEVSILNNYKAYYTALNLNKKQDIKHKWIPSYLTPRLVESREEDLLWATTSSLGNDELKKKIKENGIILETLAKDVFINGNYKVAAQLYLYAAATEKDENISRKLMTYSIDNFQLGIYNKQIDTSEVRNTAGFVKMAYKLTDSVYATWYKGFDVQQASVRLINKHIKEVIIASKEKSN